MTEITIPLAVDLNIEDFSGAGITHYEAGIVNGLIREDNDQFVVTQRPGIDIFEAAEDYVALNDRARGIYYWEENDTLYSVHDNDVYKDSYSDIGDLTTGGTTPVTMLETTGSTKYLIILDAENDAAYKITTGDTLSTLNPTNFPTTIANGGVTLDGYLFVMGTDGIIYNSNVDDPLTWAADGFINTERSTDAGVYLGQHHDHLVAIGTQSMEFFYDNANSSGSPLNRRPDISFNIGCANGDSVWENGDIIYFIGSDNSGSLGVYKLENFRVVKISKNGIDSYFTQNITQESFKVIGSGLVVQGHATYCLTMYTLQPNISPDLTIIFDDTVGMWGLWNTVANGYTTFPLVGWTRRTGGASTAARAGEGVLSNGDLITVNENMTPLDTVKGYTGYFESGYFLTGYFVESSPDVADNIELGIRTGQWGNGNNRNKVQNKLRPLMEETDTAQTLVIKWTKSGEHDVFTTGRDIDTSKRQFARRGGRFTKRNYDLTYAGSEQIYLEGLEVDITEGIN